MLNASGQISIGGSTVGQSINLQVNRSATATSNLNEKLIRYCADITTTSSQISLSDFYSKPRFGYLWKYTDFYTLGGAALYLDTASSANMQYIITATSSGYYPLGSSNFGESFANVTSLGTTRDYLCCSMSSNGAVQLYGSNPGFLYVSTDYGSSFTQRGVSNNWTTCAVSETGQRMTAILSNGEIAVYNSSNYGVTWTKRATLIGNPVGSRQIAASNTQQYMIATLEGANSYISTNYGNTWTQIGVKRTGYPYYDAPYGTACSANGQIMYLAAEEGSVFRSNNYGTSWVHIGGIPQYSLQLGKMDCSDDGRYVIVTNTNGTDTLWVSSDYFTTNTQIKAVIDYKIGSMSGGYPGVEVSANGDNAIVLGNNGDFFKMLLY